MDDIYVSVDIDFWCEPCYTYRDIEKYLKSVLQFSENRKAFVYHHEMLEHINKSCANTVFNIDYHSDISDMTVKSKSRDKKMLNEGTWGNFVKFRHNGHFKWFYPNPICYTSREHGRCDTDVNPFEFNSSCGWSKVSKQYGKPNLDYLKNNRVAGIGVCFSPDWIDHYKICRTAYFLKENNVEFDSKRLNRAINSREEKFFF